MKHFVFAVILVIFWSFGWIDAFCLLFFPCVWGFGTFIHHVFKSK